MSLRSIERNVARKRTSATETVRGATVGALVGSALLSSGVTDGAADNSLCELGD